MVRALLLLLVSVLLFAGGGSHAVAKRTDRALQADMDAADAAPADAAPADDCCPPRLGQTDQDGDCCDFDLGQCCANGTVAPAPDVTATVSPSRVSAVEFRGAIPPELLRTRATGPPPLPPPIG